MRKRSIVGLIVLNLLLAAALLASPLASFPVPRSILDNCCKDTDGPLAYCCKDCCLLTGDECDVDGECQDS